MMQKHTKTTWLSGKIGRANIAFTRFAQITPRCCSLFTQITSPSSGAEDVVSVPVVEKLANDGLGTLRKVLFSLLEETATPITENGYDNVLSKQCLRTNR